MSKQHMVNTYKSISNWHKFRLRLFGEGIIVGVCAGLVISLFRFGIHQAEAYRGVIYSFLTRADVLYNAGWFVLLLALAFLLHRFNIVEPMAAGSGIPQVKGALLGLIKMRWFSILWVKLCAGVLGIGAGLSLGREGPSIQLGAVTAQGFSRLMGRTHIEERYLLTSGASAGLAAAFNAPLAGVIFALEELHRNFSIVVLLPSMAAAFTATIVSRFLFGRAAVFDIPELQLLPLEYYGVLFVVAIAAGLVGVIFNKGLLNIGRFYSLPIFPKPVYKIIFALLTAGCLGYVLPEVLGGGNELINHIAKSPVSLQLLLLFFFGKLVFTLISYGCGVPGGFFLPMLVLGALTGSICANIMISLGLVPSIYGPNIVVIAMAAMFSSSVRAPITGTVLIMEMTSSYQQLLTLAIAAMLAFVVAEFCESKPIYEELLNRMLNQSKPKEELLSKRHVTEYSIASGSPVENKLIKDIRWPENVLLVDVRRGEEDIVPAGGTRLRAGDFIYVLTPVDKILEIQKLVNDPGENE